MKPRISVLTIAVSDLERSLRFYRDGLGLPTEGIVGREFEHGAVAFFDLSSGMKLAIWAQADIATTRDWRWRRHRRPRLHWAITSPGAKRSISSCARPRRLARISSSRLPTPSTAVMPATSRTPTAMYGKSSGTLSCCRPTIDLKKIQPGIAQ